MEQSNAGHYYNRTKQGPGVITADQLPVVNAIQQTNKQGTLTIRLQHPYNEFTEVKGIIRVVDNNGTQVPSENTTDGSVNFPLLYDRKYSIAVPQNITLVTNMVSQFPRLLTSTTTQRLG